VRKADSQLPGAFRSHPGPLGEMRGGAPLPYFAPLPPPAAGDGGGTAAGAAAAADTASVTPAWLPHEAYQAADAAVLAAQRVVVWTLTAGAAVPPPELLAQLDGLVLAGSGTGSLPAAVLSALAPWVWRLPVVIASRCSVGANQDAFLYKGSRAKYEQRGYVLGGGFEQLNPL
jgi:L-asparaginase